VINSIAAGIFCTMAHAVNILKIASFNINGIRSRLSALLEWLERESPDVVCLQELKAPDAAFPKGMDPVESRRGLPDGEGDTHSRYLEAAAHGLIVGCLYLPNGNPQPGPKFDYKLAWFERLIKYAASLYQSGHPIVLAGDYNVVPTDEDIYNPRSWLKDALLQPESRERYQRLLAQGWTDSLRARYPNERIYTFWDYFRQHWQKDSGLRIDHLLLSAALAPRLRKAGVDRWVRDRPHASDHAPTWIELDMSAKEKKAQRKSSTVKPS
jgi:exodeoxyribonuclease-3